MKKIIISGILIAIGAVAFHFKNEKPVQIETVRTSLTVKTMHPKLEKISQNIQVSGPVSAWQEATISSEVAGLTIESIYVDVGQSVKKGQILAKLKSDTIVADVNQARAAVQEATANLSQAKSNADIARNIEKTNALSAQKITEYLTSELAANARLASAKSQLESQNIRLRKTNIIAPDDGIVSYRNASVGNLSSNSEMFKIILQEKLQWKAQVSSSHILNISKGMSVSLNHTNIKAVVSEIAPSVDDKTRQGTVYVNLDKATHQNKIKSGMFVEGQISIGDKEVLVAPQQAVILREGFNYVFVVSNNKAKQVKVTTGQRLNNDIEISGISPEDNIVVTGATFLKDDDTVRVVQ